MITGRRQKPLEETVDQIEAAGGKATYLSVDVSKTDQVQRMVDETIATIVGYHRRNADIAALERELA